MDSWLIWNLTGRHLTDITNAHRTQLVSLDTLDWDEELLDTFHVPRAMLPEIRSSSEVYGHAQDTLWGVPVAAALGDQQAALVGQGCLSPGQAKRSEEHTSELQSLMRISYAVFFLKKKHFLSF